MQNICKDWRITEQEYIELDKKFGKLAEYASWELFKRNTKNNHTEEQQDIAQELRIALIRAGAYYKREVYIESCFEVCELHIKDDFIIKLVAALKHLWENKTRHGANKQKFGDYQELLLNKIVKKYISPNLRPNRNENLKIDSRFSTYCKAITWNAQRQLGKKITRERAFRNYQASISEYDYLSYNQEETHGLRTCAG